MDFFKKEARRNHTQYQKPGANCGKPAGRYVPELDSLVSELNGARCAVRHQDVVVADQLATDQVAIAPNRS